MDRRRAQAPAAPGASARTKSAPAERQLSLAEQQKETAEYLADMVLGLRNIARSAKLYTVMVPLEYAYYEAFGVANRVEVPEGEAERIRELARAGEEMDRDPGNGGI